MKFLCCFLTMLAITFGVSAEENNKTKENKKSVNNYYNYFSIGAGIPSFLSLNIGCKKQSNHHGIEISAGLTPLFYVLEGHASINYLYFPKPNLSSQSYLGLGVRGGSVVKVDNKDFSPELSYATPIFLLGKEYLKGKKDRRFIQVALGAPSITSEGNKIIPSIDVTYGLSF